MTCEGHNDGTNKNNTLRGVSQMKSDVRLTAEQLEVVKSMESFCEAFCNQIYHIMENHGLDKIEGCGVNMTIRPSLHYTARNITLGCPETDFGYCNISRGVEEDSFTVYGKNSPVYELLFARNDELARKIREIMKLDEKPEAPDGLWVSNKGE